MRTPWPAAAGGVVVALVGAAGLVRAAVPLSSGSGPAAPATAPIVISGAYVRAPAPPTDAAAAYFTVYNTTGQADTLQSVVSGAGEVSVLHADVNGSMTVEAGGVTIPAHGRLTLTAGAGHVMIEKLYGTVKAGQQVTIELTFAHAGTLDISAPVIALGAPAPTAGASPSSSSTGAGS